MSGMSRMGMRDGGRREDDERRQGAKKPVNNHRKTGDDAAARGNPKSASAGFRVAFRLRLTRPRTMLSDRPPRIAHPSGQTPAVLARERGIKLITLRAAFFRRRAETEQRPDAGAFEPVRIVGGGCAVGAETLGAMVAIGARQPRFLWRRAPPNYARAATTCLPWSGHGGSALSILQDLALQRRTRCTHPPHHTKSGGQDFCKNLATTHEKIWPIG